MTTKLTPKAQAEALLTSLLKGKDVHDIFAENFRKQMVVSGKPIDEWREQFKISIPTDNLTPAICVDLDLKIMLLSEEATFFHAVAQAKTQMLKRGSDASYNTKFWAIVEEYKAAQKKLPAAATLDTMAKLDNDEVASAETIAAIESKFWKEILDHLGMCRKLIENATINLSVEAKALQNERYIDSLNRKQNGE